MTKESSIDLTVGIRIHRRLGECIHGEDLVATLYGNDEKKLNEAAKRLIAAYTVSKENTCNNPIVYEVIRKENI